jgi:hypothetical protein
MKLDPKNNTIVKKSNVSARESRMLKIPKLGFISSQDYDLAEMPSPTMASIDGQCFDFRNSIRNSDFRSGKQYESLEIKKICPNLYFKKFKVSKFNVSYRPLLQLIERPCAHLQEKGLRARAARRE